MRSHIDILVHAALQTLKPDKNQCLYSQNTRPTSPYERAMGCLLWRLCFWSGNCSFRFNNWIICNSIIRMLKNESTNFSNMLLDMYQTHARVWCGKMSMKILFLNIMNLYQREVFFYHFSIMSLLLYKSWFVKGTSVGWNGNTFLRKRK